MPHPQRRRTFVDSKVQGALARRIIFHWLVFIGVTSAVALLLQVLSNPFRPAGEHFGELWWTHGPLLVVMLFLLPVFVLDTVKLSHRFAGPILNLRRTMRDIIEGRPRQKLQFRQNDFWRDLADDFNEMVARLESPERERSNSPADHDAAVGVHD